MAEWKKPLPTISGETKPFWDSCRKGELIIQQCSNCNEYQFYPRGICSNCWTNDVKWIHSTGKGKVWTYTVTYQNRTPGFAEDVPYVLALVELEEGVKMFTNIIACDPKEVRIGMEVEVTFVKANNFITIPYFQPIK
ncbi:MAG TPA: hypothetical protein DEZ08_07140 [Dehalococcoidia bacterium]|jgi:uncharacterized OB-fold protein|nr:hypothetical protein [Dehalococcoidia bacterium]|tara:strand:- start:570 stop:980 length:411 start_codon:yes stop_codon:yes gene_type:complete